MALSRQVTTAPAEQYGASPRPSHICIEDRIWKNRIKLAVASAMLEHGPIDTSKVNAEARDIAERAIVLFALALANEG